MSKGQSNSHFLHFVAGFTLAAQFFVLVFLLVPQMQ